MSNLKRIAKLPIEPLPYYPWRWQDFRANRKVQRMHYIARGFYRELLDEQWSDGSIPSSIEDLSDICGCPVEVMAEHWPQIRACFEEREDGRFVNSKLEGMRTGLDATRIKNAESGAAGGRAKSSKMNNILATAKRPLSDRHIGEKSREELSTKGELSACAIDSPDSPLPEPPHQKTINLALMSPMQSLPEALGALPADGMIESIVCAHPRALERNLEPIQVRHTDIASVVYAIEMESKVSGATLEEAAEMILDRTRMLADKVPREFWRYFKAISEFYREADYRKEPEAFVSRKSVPDANVNRSQARTNGNVEALGRRREARRNRESIVPDGGEAPGPHIGRDLRGLRDGSSQV